MNFELMNSNGLPPCMEGSGRAVQLSSLLFLPGEIIEEILLSPALCVPDLCRMRQVCWHLRHVVDRLWTKVAATRLVYQSLSDGCDAVDVWDLHMYIYSAIHCVYITGGRGGAQCQAPPTWSGTVSAVGGVSVRSSWPQHWTPSVDDASRYIPP